MMQYRGGGTGGSGARGPIGTGGAARGSGPSRHEMDQMRQITDIATRQLKKLRKSELEQVCKVAGISPVGLKASLVNAIDTFIRDHYRMATFLVPGVSSHKAQTSCHTLISVTEQISRGYTDVVHRRPAAPYMHHGSAMKQDGGAGAGGGYNDPGGPRMPGGAGSGVGGRGAAPARWDPMEAREVLMLSKQDPFVEVTETLSGPARMELNMGDSSQFIAYLTFDLSAEAMQLIRVAHSLEASDPLSKRNRVLLRSYKLGGEPSPEEIKNEGGNKQSTGGHLWPLESVCQVNGSLVQLKQRKVFFQGTTRKLKGDCAPKDIGHACRAGHNRIELQSSDPESFAVIVQLVRIVDVDEVFENIKEKQHLSKEKALQRVKNSFRGSMSVEVEEQAGVVEDSDDDLMATATRLSLRCPLGLVPIKCPGRGRNCTHLQCFDLSTFLNFNKSCAGAAWRCGVCNMPIKPSDVVVDTYLDEVVKTLEANKQLDDAEEVEINSDGTWRAIFEDQKAGSSRRERKKQQQQQQAEGVPAASSTATSGRASQGGDDAAASPSVAVANGVNVVGGDQPSGGGGGRGGTTSGERSSPGDWPGTLSGASSEVQGRVVPEGGTRGPSGEANQPESGAAVGGSGPTPPSSEPVVFDLSLDSDEEPEPTPAPAGVSGGGATGESPSTALREQGSAGRLSSSAGAASERDSASASAVGHEGSRIISADEPSPGGTYTVPPSGSVVSSDSSGVSLTNPVETAAAVLTIPGASSPMTVTPPPPPPPPPSLQAGVMPSSRSEVVNASVGGNGGGGGSDGQPASASSQPPLYNSLVSFTSGQAYSAPEGGPAAAPGTSSGSGESASSPSLFPVPDGQNSERQKQQQVASGSVHGANGDRGSGSMGSFGRSGHHAFLGDGSIGGVRRASNQQPGAWSSDLGGSEVEGGGWQADGSGGAGAGAGAGGGGSAIQSLKRPRSTCQSDEYQAGGRPRHASLVVNAENGREEQNRHGGGDDGKGSGRGMLGMDSIFEQRTESLVPQRSRDGVEGEGIAASAAAVAAAATVVAAAPTAVTAGGGLEGLDGRSGIGRPGYWMGTSVSEGNRGSDLGRATAGSGGTVGQADVGGWDDEVFRNLDGLGDPIG